MVSPRPEIQEEVLVRADETKIEQQAAPDNILSQMEAEIPPI